MVPCAMKESIGLDEGMGGLGLNIKGLLWRSARQLIQQAIEGEVQALLEESMPLWTSRSSSR